MGKNFQQENPVMSIQNDSPGCMWGVLQVLKYHHWRPIKKRFPNIKGTNPKHATRVGNEARYINVSQDEKIPLLHKNKTDSCMVGEELAESDPVTKGSVKSRIKALISDELNKRKGRHRRSSSSPVHCHMERTDSIRRFDPSYEDSLTNVTLRDDSPLAAVHLNNNSPKTTNNVNFPTTFSPDRPVAQSYKLPKFENSNAMLTNNQLGLNHYNENGKQFIENHIHTPENPESRGKSLVHAKEMLDALDLININKEFLLKFLQDSSSPLAHHFHSQQALSSRRACYKSMSFSLPSPSCIRASSPRNQKQNGTGYDVIEPKSKAYNHSSSMSSVAPEYSRTNQMVMKRFKDLKHKLRHIINQDNTEKHRIAMDGVLHKIPSGHELPKDLKTEIIDNMKNHSSRGVKESPRSTNESDHSLPSTSKSVSRCYSITSSISDSLDRYSQLYESCSYRESKQPSKLRTEDTISPQRCASKTIRRILSSPDLKYYCNSNDSSNDFSSTKVRDAQETIICSEQLDTKIEIGSDIQHNLDSIKHIIDEDQRGMATASNAEPEANSNLVIGDSSNLMTSGDAFCEKLDMVTPSETDIKQEETNIIVVLDSKFSEHTDSPTSHCAAEEDIHVTKTNLKSRIGPSLPDNVDSLENLVVESIKDAPTIAESKVVKLEIPSKHLKFQVGDKDKAEFDYVREILELSGFSRNELLGTWHSDDQPLDPSMLEEMDGCMPSDSEGFIDEEGYPCYQLLLFDLINQALMEIYAKSHSYYPLPLSSLSHIHPMPIGHHVLEEVWANISWYLSSSPEADQLIDFIMSKDLSKNDGWMNLQFDSECISIEVEDLIFDDLMDDLIFGDLLEGVVWS